MAQPASVQAYLEHFKAPDTPAVEYILSRYGLLLWPITQRNDPCPGDNDSTGWWFETVAANLAVRGLLYISTVSGNGCGGGAPLPQAGAAASGVRAAGSLATLGISSVGLVSSVGGPASLGFAAAGTAVGTALGFATLGIGLAIGPLMALLQHHAQAVQASENTICAVATAANEVIPKIDQAVASGSITSAQGIQAMASLVQQLNAQLAPVSGRGNSSHACNAGTFYQAMLKAHLDFANTFYVDLSPMTQKQLPVAPGSYAANAASAPIVVAQIRDHNPLAGSPTLVNSTALADSQNLNAAGSQNGTFSSVPNILTKGTGVGDSSPVSFSPMLIIVLGLAALGGFLLFRSA